MAITGIDTLDGKQIIAAGASSAISAQQALQTSGGNSLQGLYDFVSTNSGSWTGGDFVPTTATECAIGSNNNVSTRSLAQGNSNSAQTDCFSQGSQNTAYSHSIAQGFRCTAKYMSIAQGDYNNAQNECIAQGNYNTAYNTAFSQGEYNFASGTACSIGSGNSAYAVSQAFGKGNIITGTGMAIGQFNKTSADVCFVVGNGSDKNTRSDAFVILRNGSVSAAGNISANGVELGAFPSSADEACQVVTANSANWGDIPTKVVATSADATGSNILYVVTGS